MQHDIFISSQIINSVFTQTHSYTEDNFDEVPDGGGYIKSSDSKFIIITDSIFENCAAYNHILYFLKH